MLIVFGSRLIPFISFDANSCAAGITCLSVGWFPVATFLGVMPICFALATMGVGMAVGGTDWMWIVVLRGGINCFHLSENGFGIGSDPGTVR
ncbi:MAG: hypothetical protein C0524_04420 [Rhodobacter sp.]|nr:hypothetical protein [Rhodobacter sp.]